MEQGVTTGIDYEGYTPAHLSYSSIDGYRSCSKRFELQKVIGVEQRPGVAALGGNAVHTATEWYDLDVDGVWRDPATEFKKAWDDEVAKRREQSPSYTPEEYIATGRATKEYGGKKTIKWWMDHGPKMVQAWIDWRLNSGWSLWETPEGEPAVEVELNPVLPNGVPIKMFIDRIMVTPAGQLVLVDIKTGRIPETAEQLGLYACGIAQEYGEMFRPAWGYFWTPDKGHGSPQSLDMYTPEYFAEVSSAAVRGVNAGAFLAKPANGCANWCSVARFCPAVGGTMPNFSQQQK